jgi:hypothetical protein
VRTHISFRTFSTIGNSDLLDALKFFIEFDNVFCGDGVEQLEIEILLSVKKPVSHLSDLYLEFQEALPSKPKVKFFRSTKKLKITYLSEVDGANYDSYSTRDNRIRYKETNIELQASINEYRDETSNWNYPERHYEFTVFVQEFQRLFRQLESTLKEKYNFDCQPLLSKLERLQDSLPLDEETLAEMIRISNAAKYASPEVPAQITIFHSTVLPTLIPVNRFQSKTQYVGVTSAGNQFWGQIINIFKPSLEEPKNIAKHYYIVLHTFRCDGTHIRTINEEIQQSGQDELVVMTNAKKSLTKLLSTLGEVEYKNIAIRLFQTTIAGSPCGLVDTSTEEFGDSVTMKPAGLIFCPPWDGSFDT